MDTSLFEQTYAITDHNNYNVSPRKPDGNSSQNQGYPDRFFLKQDI
jgi:hypothetical protein